MSKRKEYPIREIFCHGLYVQCQVMNWSEGKAPKYLACNGLTQPGQFIARQALGTWCEVEVRTFVDKVNRMDAAMAILKRHRIGLSADGSLMFSGMERADVKTVLNALDSPP